MTGMLRVLSLASFLLLAASEQSAGATNVTQECSEALFFISAGVVGASAIYDIATAPAAARHYNQAHLSIAPRLDPRHGSYGFSASWSFGRSSLLASRSIAVPAPRWQGRSAAAPATKSPSTAFLLSFVSTTAPIVAGAVLADQNVDAGWVMVFGGGIIGPSVGHFYVGNVGRGLGTVGLRGGATVLGLYSLAGCWSS